MGREDNMKKEVDRYFHDAEPEKGAEKKSRGKEHTSSKRMRRTVASLA